MIRILVQRFRGNKIKGRYETSYQFTVDKNLPDDWSLQHLAADLRKIPILKESVHKEGSLK